MPGDPVDDATDATRRWWRQQDRYGALLLVLVLNYLTGLLFEGFAGGQGLVLALTIVSLHFALHTSGVHGRVRLVAGIACVVAVAIAAFEAGRGEADASALLSLVMGLLLLSAPVAILRRILGYHRIVSIETLAAALCTYLLLGLGFANLYIALDTWTDGTFTNIESADRVSDLIYFSFITLTTVGFGDIVPTGDVARSLVVTEALLGQIVLVTFVGRIVGQMPGETRSTQTAEALEDDHGRLDDEDDPGTGTDSEPGPAAGPLPPQDEGPP
jgi:hypothetical protein